MLGIINNKKEDWWKCCAIFVQQFTKTVRTNLMKSNGYKINKTETIKF
jgi:hypothetical protein